MITIRKAVVDDLDAIMLVQSAVYTAEYVEDVEVFRAIVDHGTSFVAVDSLGAVIGYLLCHASVRDVIYALNLVPDMTDGGWMFIHDLSILPGYRRNNAASNMLVILEESFRQIQGIQLIAVNGAESFWKRVGFVKRPRLQITTTASYGGSCVFMEKRWE